jgi:hypothetical protein
MFRPTPYFPRARRAAVKHPALYAAPRASDATVRRTRKGLLAGAKTLWRRCATGSNHISAFGVWRGRARRGVARINRRGETRWHRLPSFSQQVLSQKGTP